MTIVYCSWATGDDTTGTGTAGINYKVACKITTSAGRTDERTIWIKVSNR